MQAILSPWPNFYRENSSKCGIPELEEAKKIPANHHNNEPLFDHLVNTLEASMAYRVELRYACLLHDIGKVKAWDKTNNTFHKHELHGEQIAKRILLESHEQIPVIEYVCNLVRHHMFYFEELPSDNTAKKWLRKVGPDWFDLFLLRMADRRGNVNKSNKPAFTKQMQDLEVHLRGIIRDNTVIFEKDLPLTRQIILDLIAEKDKIEEVIPTVMGVVNNKPELNHPQELKSYILRTYA